MGVSAFFITVSLLAACMLATTASKQPPLITTRTEQHSLQR